MRTFLSALALLVLVAGCHKNDVDIAELNTNTFDADHPGVTTFITVDMVVTQSYGQGTLYKQLVTLQVHPELFPAASAYKLAAIELTVPDTTYFYSSNTPGNTFVLSNYLVQPGTEYCYRFELTVGDELVGSKVLCAVAQL
ncbi:MAG: hypothetical protein ACOH13_09225 [Flavobacteriales bacterium]